MRIAVAILLVLTSLAPAAFAAQKNVLLIISDDQGLDGGCFGNPAVATPNLDKLASEGTRFANAFATVSSCSPSRAVIQTGLYTHQNGQYGLAHAAHNQWTRPNVACLAKLLGERGYRTANIGKNHVQPASVYNYEVTVGPGGATPTAEAASKFLAEKVVAPATLSSGSAFVVVLSPDAQEQWLYLADGTNHKVWILRRSDLEIVGEFGRGGRQVGQFLRPHGMSIDSQGNLYVGEASTGRRVQKFALQRAAAK